MMIQVQNLSKCYGRYLAVDDVSFNVPAGSLFAFLGTNGAGKSTTIGCLTTTLLATSGVVKINGLDVLQEPQKVKRIIGTVFQEAILDPGLTVKENLTVRGAFYGLTGQVMETRIGELSELVSLESFVGRKYGLLSGGQKRRADIARALLHSPSVIFLDEPTAGLDPQSREQIWAALNVLQVEQGMTVFLTTHYLEETERADQVCIINKGKIIARGTPAELRSRYSSSVLSIYGKNHAEIRAACQAFNLDHRSTETCTEIFVSSPQEAIGLLRSLDVADFEFRHGTMDDVFLNLTGKGNTA